MSNCFLRSCVRLKRPVRCMLDRDEDMLITGGRHPFYGKYKVGGCPLLEREGSAAVIAGVAGEGGGNLFKKYQNTNSSTMTRFRFALLFCLLSFLLLLPFLLLFLQVGFLNSGKVVALDVSYYSNTGNSMDLSLSVCVITNNISFSQYLLMMC